MTAVTQTETASEISVKCWRFFAIVVALPDCEVWSIGAERAGASAWPVSLPERRGKLQNRPGPESPRPRIVPGQNRPGP